MVVCWADFVAIECVVRGYLSGSGWKEYRQAGTVCGLRLSEGLGESDRLPQRIFTPATKADEGHDENISLERMCELAGEELSHRLRDASLSTYQRGAEYARERGIIIADTKFEFGLVDGNVILIDEVLTPDSSRFWPIERYETGHRSTSSVCATGSSRQTGTRTASRRNCPQTSWLERARSTSRLIKHWWAASSIRRIDAYSKVDRSDDRNGHAGDLLR